MNIEYSDLPGFQNLFLDYINEFENVKEFYSKNFRDDKDFLKTFLELEKYERPHKKEIVKIISNQYSEFKISKQTTSHIKALEQQNTFAIVTGQQVSLFGGPMYTLYKTITAIKLSNLLNEKYSDYNFVPIFWMETDDHDFDEVASVSTIDKDNKFTTLTYNDGLEEEVNRGSVGNNVFNQNINSTLDDLDNSLRDNEFKDDIVTLLRNCYQEGATFKESFKKLLFNLFDEYGLVIFDPQDSAVKDLLLPIFEKEITSFTTHTATNVLRSAELEEIYHAQVKIKPINIFYSDETGRHLVEPTENGFRFKGKRKKLNEEELLNLLYFDPTAFSPNVLLRPICQDYLFPTAVYIGGPSEISYFAQVMPNYLFFDIVSPILFPRSSATIMEMRQLATMKRYELSLSDFTCGENTLIEKVIKQISEFNFDELFAKSELDIKNTLDELKNNLLSVDKALEQPIEKSIKRIEQTLLTLEEKSRNAEERKHQTVVNQLRKVRNSIFPNNTLQEREVSFIYFANKYGIDVVKWIMSELKTNKIEHQILEV